MAADLHSPSLPPAILMKSLLCFQLTFALYRSKLSLAKNNRGDERKVREVLIFNNFGEQRRKHLSSQTSDSFPHNSTLAITH
mmetsp:Transcript_44516/g.51256  ORF Transcript_44516/g.51256 Transcript_44516/m.51256 type:complete len:82 (+) Transcript_44516:401-646(+)